MLEIRICKIICYELRNMFQLCWKIKNGHEVENNKILFWLLIYKTYSLVSKF